MKIRIPQHIPGLLNKVPEKDQPKGEQETVFWSCVAYELAQLMHESIHTKEPQIVFNDMRVAGEQYIWEFYVNDLTRPKTDSVNWHGQNTSQWVYAGAILLLNGRVSTHH